MRVCGLDISKEGVACVEIETAFGRFEIRETTEIPMPEDQLLNPEAPYALASQLLHSLPHAPGRLVVSVPSDLTTFRNLQIATRDKKAIKAALEYELEDDLPFEKDELHYDSVILEAGAGGSLIHVGAVKKESLAKTLTEFTNRQVDPDIVTTDAWAYRSLFSRIAPNLPNTQQTQDTILLWGFERHRTFFYVHAKNQPVLYREFPFGTDTLKAKLKSTLSGSEAEATAWIRDIGVTGIDESVSNAIEDILEVLVPEFKQTDLAVRAILRNSVDLIYVTGEGALLPGFLEWLSNATNKSTAIFKPLSLLSPAQVSYSEVSEVRFARALALAMTTLPGDKLPVLNLRKKDFAKTSSDGLSPLELIKKPLPYLLTLLLVFFVTKTIEYNYYQSKVSDTEENLKRAVKGYFGGISDSAARSHMADSEKLKKSVQDDLARERELSKLFTPNPNSPLDLLKNLSQKIGKDVVVDMVNFDAGSDNKDRYTDNKPIRVTLSFIVSNAQTLAKLSDIVERTFGLKKGNSEEITQEGKSAYKVMYVGTFGGKP